MSRVNFVRDTTCFEAVDNSVLKIPAASLNKGAPSRRVQEQSARLGHQFLNQNQGLLEDFGIEGNVEFDGAKVDIHLKTGVHVGALPLLSPTTGRPDYGLVIKPRFGWQGIGSMPGTMGWKILPEPLPLPLLPRSEYEQVQGEWI